MSRTEFSKATKRAALERSQMRCEAIGKVYGLEQGIRCSVSLSKGVDFDHIVADALGGDNSLSNCAAVCKRCHQIKTATNDVPKAAKTKRVSDKALGIKNDAGPKLQSRGFPKQEKQQKTLTKALPPRRSLFQERVE